MFYNKNQLLQKKPGSKEFIFSVKAKFNNFKSCSKNF